MTIDNKQTNFSFETVFCYLEGIHHRLQSTGDVSAQLVSIKLYSTFPACCIIRPHLGLTLCRDGTIILPYTEDNHTLK